ncbi:SMC-Scp complex subunit ScpB [Novispirillum sp. DQ9]|uniref:SMC-Scp complex subunit ScpB n=1 Tax=Novispirillum sp. DQ9 TaxID=3398612 RepID=UPI003C7D8DDC
MNKIANPIGTGAPSFDVDRHQHLRILEALLFAAVEPLPTKTLAQRLPDGVDVRRLLDDLAEHYRGRGIELKRFGDTWAFRTAPDLGTLLRIDRDEPRKLTRAALETLAIIAYHQPVTRAEIEDIRGVAVSKGTLDTLLEAGWVRPRGRRQTPGRPLTWGTSAAFLDHFGLDSLADLPGVEELKAAGLLDARPAIAAYGARARDDGALVDIDEDSDGEEEERGRKPQLDLLDEE